MPGLLDLPAELRLRIYEFVVSEPWSISMIDFNCVRRPRGIKQAAILSQVDIDLRDDIIPLFWSTNTFCMYLAVNARNPHIGKHLCHWLENFVGEAARHIRRLEFIVTAACDQRRKALENPKEPGIWYRRDAPYCTTTIYVDLTKPTVIVDEDDYCSHKTRVLNRFTEVLASIPRVSRQPQISKDSVWDLFEGCNVLSTRYRGYWTYDQAVRIYEPKIAL
jgi:hypothetical protein